MQWLEQVAVRCPYCGEPLHAALEHVMDVRDYVSECPICFCTVRFRVTPVIHGRFHRVQALRHQHPHPAA